VPRPCGLPTDSVRSTSSFFKSMTATVSWFATATKARSPVRSIAMPSGCDRWEPTWMSLTFFAPAMSITDTVPGVSFAIRPVLPSGVIAAPYG
jgi:hypothetical protein